VIRLSTLGRNVILSAATLVILSPIGFIAVTALKSQSEYARNPVGIPSSLTLSGLRTVLSDPRLGTWFLNSAVITVGSVVLATVVALLAAYPMARAEGFPSRFIPALVVLMAIPPVVLVVPLFIVMVNLGLINSRTGVILIYAGLLTPLSTYLLTGFIRDIPASLDEAASIDGAGRASVLLYVLVPLMKPALVTVMIVGAVYVWNEFLIALLFLQATGSQTLMVGIASLQGKYGINETLLAAWSLVASLPVILVYALGQRFFIRGLVGGALK
jgi:ABC-type glycerol-3-phosphate transport system permease component